MPLANPAQKVAAKVDIFLGRKTGNRMIQRTEAAQAIRERGEVPSTPRLPCREVKGVARQTSGTDKHHAEGFAPLP
jgi:hypothetical protein